MSSSVAVRRLLLSRRISRQQRGGVVMMGSVVNIRVNNNNIINNNIHRMLFVMAEPTAVLVQRYYNCSSSCLHHLAASATKKTTPTFQKSLLSTTSNINSTAAAAVSASEDYDEDEDDEDGPWGDLFHNVSSSSIFGEIAQLVGKTANIRRTFGPRSNAQAFLVCGGEALAKHASFDPDYVRAQGWIRHHAVGPAVLSPVLISGLVGALVEAALPQSVPIRSSMHQIRPLIVGVEVCATIEVIAVDPDGSSNDENDDAAAAAHSNNDNSHSNVISNDHQHQQRQQRQHGYQIELKTMVSRVQDEVAIAEGRHYIWIPDYLHM